MVETSLISLIKPINSIDQTSDWNKIDLIILRDIGSKRAKKKLVLKDQPPH